MSEAINAETFRPYVGRPASLANGQALTLVAIDLHPSPPPSAAPGSSFSLHLRGAQRPSQPKGCIGSRSRMAQASSSISFPSTRLRATIKTTKSSSIDREEAAARLVLRWKDALEGDAVVQREERHAVFVRLSPGGSERAHPDRRRRGTVDVHRRRSGFVRVAFAQGDFRRPACLSRRSSRSSRR